MLKVERRALQRRQCRLDRPWPAIVFAHMREETIQHLEPTRLRPWRLPVAITMHPSQSDRKPTHVRQSHRCVYLTGTPL